MEMLRLSAKIHPGSRLVSKYVAPHYFQLSIMCSSASFYTPSHDQTFTRGRFKGKVVFVTGGASGIGRASVERFVNDGAAVAILDLNESLGRKLESELQAEGHSVTFFTVDVSDKEKCVEAVRKMAESTGGVIHSLVNNASNFSKRGIEVSQADWTRTMAVNVIGYANMVQACHPYMKKAGSSEGCAVVNIASIAAHHGQPERWNYAASKGAVVSMTRGMALDLAADGIRVNSISPAWTWTPHLAGAAGTTDRDSVEREWGKYHMLKRMCNASEIAAAVTFLCSRDASFITGTDLKVDGGSMSMSVERFADDTALSDRAYQKDNSN